MQKVPQRSHEMKMVLLLELICDKLDWWTMLDLARELGYKSSRTVRPQLDDLLQRGLIEMRSVTRPNGQIRYEYRGLGSGCDLLTFFKAEGFV